MKPKELDPEAVVVVNMARLCEKMHCLPRPGGMLDQDSYTMLAFQTVFAADAEREEKDSKRNGPGRS